MGAYQPLARRARPALSSQIAPHPEPDSAERDPAPIDGALPRDGGNILHRLSGTPSAAPAWLANQGRYVAVDPVVQRRGDAASQHAEGETETENRTGLPDALKAGVESLSGLSLDDVRVNYGSARPAAVGALAYTQGSEVHVGPGQERHLAHEAWHVVQQKQGRVKPTLQAKGQPVNDDAGLEAEADTMGARAARGGDRLPPLPVGAFGARERAGGIAADFPATIQRIKYDAKKHGKTVKAAVERLGEDVAGEDEVKECLAWVDTLGQFDLFTASEGAWKIYEEIHGKMTVKDLLKAANGAENEMLTEAKGILDSQKGGAAPSTKKDASAKKQEKAAKKEAEAEEEARRLEAEKEQKAAQDKQDKQNARLPLVQAYAGVRPTNALAQGVWDFAADTYVRDGVHGKVQLTYGSDHSEADIVTALTSWRGKRAAVQGINGIIKDISTFKEPQDKAGLGKGNVGNTLEKRDIQGNFILFFSADKQAYINVHVNVK